MIGVYCIRHRQPITLCPDDDWLCGLDVDAPILAAALGTIGHWFSPVSRAITQWLDNPEVRNLVSALSRSDQHED